MSNSYYSKSQDITFRMTTVSEERELFAKARAGDEVAREFLIRNHLLFAMMQAKRLVNGSLPNDEVTSAANFAVMKAFESFDAKRGYRFTTYVRNFIRGEVASLWRSKFSCGVIDPSASNSTQFIENVAPQRRNLLNVNQELDSTQQVPDESPTVEEIDLKKFNRLALAKAMLRLPKRDAEFLRLYYVEDFTYERIAKRFRMTRQNVQAFHARSIDKLRVWLKREGVQP